MSLHQQSVGAHRDRLNDLTRENGELILRNQSNNKHIAGVRCFASSSRFPSLSPEFYSGSSMYSSRKEIVKSNRKSL
jgi:hypothetical protein